MDPRLIHLTTLLYHFSGVMKDFTLTLLFTVGKREARGVGGGGGTSLTSY